MKIKVYLAPDAPPFMAASDPLFARLDAPSLQRRLAEALAAGGDPEATIRGAIEAERRRLKGEEKS